MLRHAVVRTHAVRSCLKRGNSVQKQWSRTVASGARTSGHERNSHRNAYIIGTGISKMGKVHPNPQVIACKAMENALADAHVPLSSVSGLVAVPALSDPRFMWAHYLATKMKMLPHPNVLVKTLDTGGAGPITGLIEAKDMIQHQGCDVVAVVAADSVSSLPADEFLRRADSSLAADPDSIPVLPSPVVPHGYSRITDWHRRTYGVSREATAMCSVLMSHQAARHPAALTRKPYSLDDVLGARPITPEMTLLECARRSDGGGAVIVASEHWLRTHQPKVDVSKLVRVSGGGEASGPLYPPAIIDEDMFSCEQAATWAYQQSSAAAGPEDIHFFGLYDCFPICLLRAIEAVGLAPKGEGHIFVQDIYERLQKDPSYQFPINTHGGLMCFAAPWEAPAIFNVIEACQQLQGRAGDRQLRSILDRGSEPVRALCYGNGGIFSASAICILERAVGPGPGPQTRAKTS